MRVVILGCGYLGTALARKLRVHGHAVSALTRNAAAAAALRALDVAPVICADMASTSWHGELDSSGAAVVNCVSPAAPSPEGYRHSFIAGAKSLRSWLEKSAAAGSAPARDLLFTSATSVYPQTDGAWVDEDTVFDSSALSEAGAILREAENLHRGMSPVPAQRTWVLRLAGVYGPGRHQMLDKLREGDLSVAGNPDHWLNLIHRDDAVSAMWACVDAPSGAPGGCFNVVDDEPVHKRDLVSWLAQQAGLDPATIRYDSAGSARSPHRRGRGNAGPHRRVSNRRLREQLAWKPAYPTFREGYRKILSTGR